MNQSKGTFCRNPGLRVSAGLHPTLNACTLHGTESLILVLEFTRDRDELRAQELPGFHKASRRLR